ncbi:MAG: four helix bundle protein [Patescibacteria group bacterium]|nr:four helix bundle protein [Patescibacteria group bacterium]
MNYDLEERSGKFGETVIGLCKELRNDDINRPLINQIIKSATSIGANYMEANEGASTKDFRNKIKISQKEANETKHWIRMIAAANPEKKNQCRIIWQEAHELTLILATISRNSVKN